MANAKSETDLAKFRFELLDPITLDRVQRHQIIHDIKAATLSYSMLIESLQDDMSAGDDSKKQKKLLQLRQHEATLKALTERVIEAISEKSDTRANS